MASRQMVVWIVDENDAEPTSEVPISGLWDKRQTPSVSAYLQQRLLLDVLD